MKLPLPKNKPRSWLILAVLMLLPACTDTISSCGVLIPYSDETQDMAASELVSMNCCPTVHRMMDDYHKTRDTIRACK